jgi:hypothetical protein
MDNCQINTKLGINQLIYNKQMIQNLMNIHIIIHIYVW